MRILTSTILMCMISTAVLGGYGGNIGIKDDRRYGSLEDPLYSAIARLNVGAGNKSGCTAGFIAKNLILTNYHCHQACISKECTITFWDGTQYQDSPIHPFIGPRQNPDGANDSSYMTGTDWVIYSTDIPNPNFKQIAQSSSVGQVNRGGFGCLRIIKDSELPELKSIYADMKRKYLDKCKEKYPDNYIACINNQVNNELKRRNIKPLFEDGENFKIQECDITGYLEGNRKMMKTNCDSAGGDSGAPLLRGNTIVALNNSGPQGVFKKDEANGASALNTDNFYPYAQIAIAQSHLATNPGTTTNNVEPAQPSQQSETPSAASPTNEPVIITDPNELQQVMNSQLQNFQCD